VSHCVEYLLWTHGIESQSGDKQTFTKVASRPVPVVPDEGSQICRSRRSPRDREASSGYLSTIEQLEAVTRLLAD